MQNIQWQESHIWPSKVSPRTMVSTYAKCMPSVLETDLVDSLQDNKNIHITREESQLVLLTAGHTQKHASCRARIYGPKFNQGGIFIQGLEDSSLSAESNVSCVRLR